MAPSAAPAGLGDFFQHRFETIFELAAKLGAGDERAQIERNQAFLFESLRHIAVDDAQSQAFDDGGFADAGFADQYRVVFRAPRQDLNHPANFVVAADHRIELALARQIGQIAAVLFQGLVLLLGIGIGDALGAANPHESLQNFVAAGAVFLEKLARLAGVVDHGKQQVFGGNVFVLQRVGLGLGIFDNLFEPRRDIALARAAGNLRQSIERLLQPIGQIAQRHAELLQDRRDHAFFLTEQCEEQMLDIDRLVIPLFGKRLRLLQRFLRFGRKFIQTHF